MIKQLIEKTHTKTGLKVSASIMTKIDETGYKKRQRIEAMK